MNLSDLLEQVSVKLGKMPLLVISMFIKARSELDKVIYINEKSIQAENVVYFEPLAQSVGIHMNNGQFLEVKPDSELVKRLLADVKEEE